MCPAAVDDGIDNGTLQYMDSQLGSQWVGPEHKGVFLTCES
jgi:hypothetical protein